jgi:putative glutamine amidotransferase
LNSNHRMVLRFKILLFIYFLSSIAFAGSDNISLWAWRHPVSGVSAIIPVRITETPQIALEKYIESIEKTPDLFELYLGQISQVKNSQSLAPISTKDSPRSTLLIANMGSDTEGPSKNYNAFNKQLIKAGQKTFVLPLGAALRLSRAERLEFYTKIANSFSGLVAMGGEDVDPQFYKRNSTFSINTNSIRDQLEIELIKHYVRQEKGFLLGICRGSQISAVALGYELIQDLPFEKGTSVMHKKNEHAITLSTTSNQIFKNILGTINTNIEVNSFHHQAIRFKNNGPLEVAARAADGTIEATEFKNARGLLLQFHPEFMENSLGEQILRGAINQKNLLAKNKCSQLF